MALAVFALVVIGLLNLAGESTRTAAHVERAVLAGIVADNLAAEATLTDASALTAPAQGTERLGERDWHWRRMAATTGDAGLLRIDIEVAGDDGAVAADAAVFR